MSLYIKLIPYAADGSPDERAIAVEVSDRTAGGYKVVGIYQSNDMVTYDRAAIPKSSHIDQKVTVVVSEI